MMPGEAMLFLFAVIMAALLLFMMVFFVSFFFYQYTDISII